MIKACSGIYIGQVQTKWDMGDTYLHYLDTCSQKPGHELPLPRPSSLCPQKENKGEEGIMLLTSQIVVNFINVGPVDL